MNEEAKIPERIAKLIDFDGFNGEVESRWGVHLTLEEAYESVERTFEHHYGRRKYSDYDTYRIMRNKKKSLIKNK